MNITNPLILQLIIDLALLVAVVVLLWHVNANLKKPILKSHQAMISELKEIIAESQAASENFIQALEKSRLALKEIAIELDIKEQRVKKLLDKSESSTDESIKSSVMANSQDKYHLVIDMIRKGYSETQTAEATGFTEPEIGLIVDLYKVKNENV